MGTLGNIGTEMIAGSLAMGLQKGLRPAASKQLFRRKFQETAKARLDIYDVLSGIEHRHRIKTTVEDDPIGSAKAWIEDITPAPGSGADALFRSTSATRLPPGGSLVSGVGLRIGTSVCLVHRRPQEYHPRNRTVTREIPSSYRYWPRKCKSSER